MKSRGVVVVLALILATIATAGVFLYSKGVKQEAIAGGDLHEVVVSKVDIPATTELDDLIAQGQFELLQVPGDAVVAGAVTDLSQLRGRTSSAYIVAGEQIPMSRVQTGEIPGGVLGIPEGHQAMSVSLGGPRAIAGAVASGDRVAIYATFEEVNADLLPRGFQGAATPTQPSGEGAAFDATVILVPEVEVLRVFREAPGGAGSSDEESQQQDPSGSVLLTLAFTPEEAARFVFALEQGAVYLSLLPPEEPGATVPPVTVARIFLSEKTG